MLRVTEYFAKSLNLTQRQLKLAPFESLGAVSYSLSIVTTALSCIISETKRDIGRKSQFFTPLAFGAPLGQSSSEYCHTVWHRKLEWCGYPKVRKM